MGQGDDRQGGGPGSGPGLGAARLRVLPGGGEALGDDQLVRAFLVGDDDAFEELWRRHEPTVHAVVRRYAREVEDARDLVQRAFLKALTAARKTLARADAAAAADRRSASARAAAARTLVDGIPSLPGAAPFPFRAWLLRIAVNLAKNFARDRRRWRGEPLETVRGAADGALGAEEALLRRERQGLLRAAVLELPRRQREVLTLRIDAGLAFSEIAEVLAITENNAKVHFHHATRRLRDLVREEEP